MMTTKPSPTDRKHLDNLARSIRTILNDANAITIDEATSDKLINAVRDLVIAIHTFAKRTRYLGY